MYLLDTNICIFLLKENNLILNRVEKEGLENCFISEISLAELKYGAENSQNPKKHHKQVDYLTTIFSVLPINSALDIYAFEKARLKTKGTSIDDFDLLIGATAIVNNLVMVTNNTSHLTRMQGIKIDDWTKEGYIGDKPIKRASVKRKK